MARRISQTAVLALGVSATLGYSQAQPRTFFKERIHLSDADIGKIDQSQAYGEYPFVYKDDDGKIIEGNIDLVYQQADEWVIVDFKTGPANRLE